MTNLTTLQNKTIFFVGGGNMATALIDGLLGANADGQLNLAIGVSDPNQANLDNFTAKGMRAVLPAQAGEQIANSDIVVLAVKPQMMGEVCESIRAFVGKALIISIAAGLSIDTLGKMTGSTKIVRTMPNLPATVGYGATGLFANADNVDNVDKELATAVMAASGAAVWVNNETDLHSVTAVAGSAPAYFFYVLEQMIAKAVSLGLDANSAKALAVQSMMGAATMAQDGEPSELRAKVTSKGGTTHAAISSMQDHQVGEHIQAAMQACYDRSVELGA
ncbi:MAG: pyrroline-5-carboxylate reductase [Moraxella sp.]|nr:pyrroline-5-carboxylate reductase [Moraxella sp.]